MPLYKKPKLPRTSPQGGHIAGLGAPLAAGASLDCLARRLELGAEERASFELADALVLDATGRECLRGLSADESLEFVELSRRGLDNGDADFLRLVELGDRIASNRVRPLS
jgi:hypothetical protein